jgi:hypothetical protein
MYDFRLRDSNAMGNCGMTWPDGLSATTEYLSVCFYLNNYQKQEVIKALHAENAQKTWTECDSSVHSALQFDNSRPSSFVNHF